MSQKTEKRNLSRRELLKNAGALLVGFNLISELPLTAQQQQIPGIAAVPDGMSSYPYANPDYLDPTILDSWLSVQADGMVTIATGKVDIGTGIETALGQIAADELDVPFEKVRVIMGDTARTVDQGRTAGSQSVARAGPQLRQAAAAGRLELLKLASARLGAPAEKLTVTDGVVSVLGEPNKKVTYGELIGGKQFNVNITATGIQGAMIVAPEIKAKSYKDYKVVGKPIRRVDLPRKLTGEFQYTSDVRIAGMLHGRVVRPRNVISGPPTVDENSINQIAGIVKVVRDGSFVGIVAKTEWAAIQAAKTLKVIWPAPVFKLPFTQEAVADYLRTTKSARDATSVNKGDVDAAIAAAPKKFEAEYHWPFQMHGMMGPCCAVADVREDKATIWTGAQGPFTTRDRIASMLKIPKRNVVVNFVESAGSYGRLTADDTSEDAVVLSRAVGKPVRVQWMREDEHVWGPKGPQQLQTVRAAVNADGKLIAWDFQDHGLPWTESQGTPQLAERQIGVKSTLLGNPNGANGGGEHYEIENHRVMGRTVPWPQDDPSPLRTSALRSPGEPPRVFGSESFMDEVAAGVGVDPIEFRLRHLTNKRVIEAIQAAAQKSGWVSRPSPAPVSDGPIAKGRGVAVATRIGTIIVAISEVEVEKATGRVSVKKVTLAHDCGLIVNPDGLRGQLDGNIMHGVSRTLLEEFRFDPSGVKSVDWASHPVIRFMQIPAVDVVLLNRPEIPSSGGAEPSVVVIPASIANAVYDAIGVRIRQVPFTPQRVLAALNSKVPPRA
ncbi:MAG: molybdopterin-dependent oxidoreductase [Acidobacteriota bacterium]|nr:molybdopterin-dependent oxidoreductase [Acidobacteriota bacterium]